MPTLLNFLRVPKHRVLLRLLDRQLPHDKVLHDVRGIERGPLRIRAGSSGLALVATGGILDETLAAAEALAQNGQSVSVYSMPWLKPLTPERLQVLAVYSAIVAVEEHVQEGGLAAALREHLPKSIPVHSVTVSETASGKVGNQAYLRGEAGVSAHQIVIVCRSWFG